VTDTDSRVSVVVPVRDVERYVAEALDSILQQSITPGEVIVVDDGSTDATPAVLERYADQVRVLRQESAGVAAALNHGIAAADGTLFAFLDADDLWLPDALACRLARLDAPDEPDAVFGRMQQFVSPDLDAAHASRFRFDPAPQHVALFGTMVVRRLAVDRVGPLDPSYVTGSNIDWISRARATGMRGVEVPDVVMRRRLHETNLGILQSNRKRSDLVRIVRAHRQRQPSAPDEES
jgi:glycosyltransferase involved in cell wall biosynthesis